MPIKSVKFPAVFPSTYHQGSGQYSFFILFYEFILGIGKVLSENSIAISGKSIENASGKTLIIVQKGDALWNIAYQRLGLGKRYTEIVDLNKDKIENPDLIFPKQLFIIPNKIN